MHRSAWKVNSTKFTVASSLPRCVETAHTDKAMLPVGEKLTNVTIGGARVRSKRLPLATAELLESSRILLCFGARNRLSVPLLSLRAGVFLDIAYA